MSRAAFAIPEKIYFKIGEVCDLVGVQAHVLRYWETEFPMLAPQKNRAGQRTYRRRDVEIALRIKELLYEDLYTIAGAKKKLQSELREATKLKVVTSEPPAAEPEKTFEPEERFVPKYEPPPQQPQVQNFAPRPAVNNFSAPDFEEEDEHFSDDFEPVEIGDEQRSALHSLAKQLSDVLHLLERKEDVPRRNW